MADARAARSGAAIRVAGVSKGFGDHRALRGLDLDVGQGELIALLGPSGSGKTTLLRLIAGLERCDGGTILFNGEDAARLPVQGRRVGFVFQHYALFRHMTVFENVAYGLRVRPARERPSRAAIRERVTGLLDLMQLPALAGRYPAQLSGGQRQRVAFARALAIEPNVLLLDEPFGALDAKVRKDLRRWLRDLHTRTGVTTLFVTHDQDEAMELADRVALLNDGRIEQVGTPEALYDEPASAFVMSFVGEAVAIGHGADTVLARPHDIGLTAPRGEQPAGTVLAVRRSAAAHRAEIVLDGARQPIDVPIDAATWKPGDRVGLTLARTFRFSGEGRATSPATRAEPVEAT